MLARVLDMYGPGELSPKNKTKSCKLLNILFQYDKQSSCNADYVVCLFHFNCNCLQTLTYFR